MGNHSDDSSSDKDLQDLLHQVGSREEPPSEMMAEVKEAVHAEWRRAVAERSRRRHTVLFGIAASVIFAVVVASSLLYWAGSAVDPVASVAKLEGTSEVKRSGLRSAVRLAVGMQVSSGDRLQTHERSRVALAFGGVSVRIDERSNIEITAEDRLVLHAGAVYVDARPNTAEDDDLVIVSNAGDVQHVGTQYQVRQHDSGVAISVREGRVRIDSNARATIQASAGEVVNIAHSGSVQKGPISLQDTSWRWAQNIAPSFDIDNQPLSAFLNWFSRETGKKIAYASPEAQVEADRIVLRGSIGTMEPQKALTVVLSTTDLHARKTNEESLELELISR